MYTIRNLKHLWFITKQNFSVPSMSVPHNSSRFCLLLWSAPPKHRRRMKVFLSNLSVSLASLSELNLVSLIRMYWFVCWTLLAKMLSVVIEFQHFLGHSCVPCWANNPRQFCHNILPSVLTMWRTFYLYPTMSCCFLWKNCQQSSLHFSSHHPT